MRIRIGGIFATDLPLAGTIVATAVDGTERKASADATGAFVLDGEFLLPAALRGETTDGRVLHAVVASAPANATLAIAHVTPLTDLIAARVANDGNPATLWTQRSTLLRQVQAADVAKVHDAIALGLAKARAVLVLTDPPDFGADAALVKRRADALLENVRVEVAPLAGGVTVYALRQAGFPANASVWSSKDDSVPTLPFREDRTVSPSALRDAGIAVFADLARVADFDRAKLDAARYKVARGTLVAAGLATLGTEQFVALFAKLLDALGLAATDTAARSFATYFDDGDGTPFERALALVDGFVASDKNREGWRTLSARFASHDAVSGVATFETRSVNGTRWSEWNMAGPARPIGTALVRPQRVECLLPRYAGRTAPADAASYVKGSVITNRCDEAVTFQACTWKDDAKGGQCTDGLVERTVDARTDTTLGDALDTRALAACGAGDGLARPGGNGRRDVRVWLRTLFRCDVL